MKPASSQVEAIMKRTIVGTTLLAAVAVAFLATRGGASASAGSAQVDRGRYLVNAIGCHDCHTPKKMGPNGPENDESRLLSGHPAEPALPEPPSAKGRPV